MKRIVTLAFAAVLVASTERMPTSAASGGLLPIETDELDMSYSLVTSEFYKKTDPQTLLDGAHARLVAYLEKNGVASPGVPTPSKPPTTSPRTSTRSTARLRPSPRSTARVSARAS